MAIATNPRHKKKPVSPPPTQADGDPLMAPYLQYDAMQSGSIDSESEERYVTVNFNAQ